MAYSKEIPTLDDFRKAAKQIKKIAMKTPLIPLRWYDENPKILLKPEIFQPIGSYKLRGVYNWAINLEPEERAKGISTISAGNMAIAVAYVGKLLGVPARGIMFDYTPESKIDAVKKYGAEVELLRSLDDALEYVKKPPKDRAFLHPLEEYGLIAGHGTVGLEIIEDAPETDTIFVPIGVGFLGAGVALAAKAIKPSVKVLGVNTEAYPLFYESFKEGKPVHVERNDTLADSITAPVTEHMLSLLQEVLDGIVLVSEDMIKDSIRYLATENKMIVEGAAATSLAAALNMDMKDRGNTVCILSGGSIDPEKVAKILYNH
jgi:threonine dehydratase